MPIPDLATITSTVDVSGFAGSITDVNVTLNITHTFDSDLVITLIAPDGTQVTLANRNGRSGDNFSNTLFDDSATTSIANGRAPFNGSYKPISALSAVNGGNANGTWTLEITDVKAQDIGTLNSWSLQISSGADFSTTTDANGNYEFVNVSPGEHHIREITPDNFTETLPASGVYDVNVADGDALSGLNFANAPLTSPLVPGDFDRNEMLDAGDISAAMTALTNVDEYMATYHVTPEQLAIIGDVNQDMQFTNADLQYLLNLLIHGGSSNSPATHQNNPSVVQPVSMSAIVSEGYTEHLPVLASSANSGPALPNSIPGLRKLLAADLQDKPAGERYRLLRISEHLSSYSALEKFFAQWVG
jgi:subtilisin-like proprotein convertase family protein